MTSNNRWQNLPVKKKLIILYLLSIPFIIYGVIEYFERQSNLEDHLDQVTLDMVSCEIIDKTLYLNSMSVDRNKKVDAVMLELWFEGNCENPDSPYWRGEDWSPSSAVNIK